MNLMIFGVGAAGNKAAIRCIENGIISEDQVKLVNTTTKDIPDEYKIGKDMVVQFSSMLGGCGKESDKGYQAMVNAIQNSQVDFNGMIPEEIQQVCIISSTEGGTGCGATPAMVKVFNAMNIPVHVFALIGFQDEKRGLQNTLKFFDRLGDSVILHTIDNSRFLDYTGNFSVAEEAANEEVSKQIEIIIGSKTYPSAQNIDDTDRYKITTCLGYCDIKSISLTGVKNKDTFNQQIIDAFENGSCFEYEPGCDKLAIIINASKRTQAMIDDKLEVIKRYTGSAGEVYRHIQDNVADTDEYIDIIVSGLAYPEQSIRNISKKYTEFGSKRQKKSMSSIFDDIDFNDDMDKVEVKQRNTKVNFGNLFGEVKSNKVATTTSVDDEF